MAHTNEKETDSDQSTAMPDWRRALWLLAFFISLEAIPVTILIEPDLLKRYSTLMLWLVLAEIAYLILCAIVLRSWVIVGAIVGAYLSPLFSGSLHGPDVPGAILGVCLGAIAGDVCYWLIRRID